MTINNPINSIIGDGWFDAPYVRVLLDAESPERIKDIEGPESDALIDYAGWSFIEEPLHVALLDTELKPLALAWIAATTRGLNLTYIVAESATAKGFATRAVAQVVVAYSERRIENLSRPDLIVHAQYEKENLASAGVATRLGLSPQRELAFTVGSDGNLRHFIGSEEVWDEVLKQAKLILAQAK